MLSVAVGHMADSPDFGAESSFPERHLEDDKTSFPGIGPAGFQSAGPKRHMFEPGPGLLSPQQGWPYNHSHIHAHALPVESNAFPAGLSQPMASRQAEWTILHEQPSEALLWQTAPSDMAIEDDSDSNQSPNGSPDEPNHPLSMLSTLPSTQKPRRRSTRGVAKPTRVPAPPSIHHPAIRTSRPYIPDFDYNTDWLDPSDPMATTFLDFLPQQPAYDHSPANGMETTTEPSYCLDTTNSPPSSSKANSKRIAHKLSEKTRRNRLTIAIREIQKLLPSEDDEDKPQARSQKESQKESREEGAEYVALRPGVPSSKLDVVEMAVGFIRELKARNEGLAKRVRELEECACRRGGRGEEVEGTKVRSPKPMEESGIE